MFNITRQKSMLSKVLEKNLVKKFLVKMVWASHPKLGFWKEIMFLKISKMMVFLPALLPLSQVWLGLAASWHIPAIRCQASFILLSREEMHPMCDPEHLKLSTQTSSKAAEARLCVLTDGKLSHQRKFSGVCHKDSMLKKKS